MIALKFAEEHVEPILEGEKYQTLRYDVDEEINAGDRLELLEAESGEPFARTTVDVTGTVSARWFVEGPNWDGHRSYDTVGELLDELRRYYPDADLGPRAELVLVEWNGITPVDGFDRGPVRNRPRELEEIQEAALDLEARP